MPTEERTGWECRFCFEQLKRCPLVGWQRLFWFVPVRTYRCPHCFNTFRKPPEFIAAIPFVRQIFCEKRGVSAKIRGTMADLTGRKSSSRRNYVNAGFMVRFARWTSSIETKASDFVKDSARRIWLMILWPLYWLSQKLGISKRSLPSYRSKSRRRSRSRRRDEVHPKNDRTSQSADNVNQTTDQDEHT